MFVCETFPGFLTGEVSRLLLHQKAARGIHTYSILLISHELTLSLSLRTRRMPFLHLRASETIFPKHCLHKPSITV